MGAHTKYLYVFVLQGDYGYGHGYEDLTASENRRELSRDLRTYRVEDTSAIYRIVKRRELR